jgi:hypothetical protein
MRRSLLTLGGLILFAVQLHAADDVVGAVAGTVRKIDEGSKVIVLDVGKGSERTFHYTDEIAVHGAKDVAVRAPKGVAVKIKAGTRVAVHYTVKGTDETAHEVDVLGKGGLKAARGSIDGIDRGSRSLVLRTEDGTKETFSLSRRAADDTGKGLGDGTKHAAKATVYFTEDAGKKVAHFFEE